MSRMISFFRRLIRNGSGQDLIEYALLLGLVAMCAAASLGSTAASINNLYSRVGTTLDAAGPAQQGGAGDAANNGGNGNNGDNGNHGNGNNGNGNGV